MVKRDRVKILNTYLASFNGRLKDAIGIKYRFKDVEVMGVNEEDALLNLYDKYERIDTAEFKLV